MIDLYPDMTIEDWENHLMKLTHEKMGIHGDYAENRMKMIDIEIRRVGWVIEVLKGRELQGDKK